MKPNAETIERGTIEGHRNPTASEVYWGYGATHYATFDLSDWLKPDGTLKHWIVSQFDGLRYYRGGH